MAQGIRLEPRGFDEHWAADAAEVERWRSVDHGKARELHDPAPHRRSQNDSRHYAPRPRRVAFTVIAAGLAVGGLLLYLFITLSGIGPPKFTRQAEVPAQATPVDAKRELSRKPAAAPMTLEERVREEEKRTPAVRQRGNTRKAGMSAAPESAPGSPEQKEQAWQRFYKPSENCQANESRGTIACANEFARTKMEFEQRWAEGRL